ncbi:MAG: DUF6713 family protein [Chloroflexota bacterium]|nr:DUF6713 family protein [Chloroflexota bacterium]
MNDSFADLLFLLVIAWLITHELDAIHRREWRFFLDPARVSDTLGYRIFTAAHIPLFVLILANLDVPSVQITLDLFVIFHAGLHWVLRAHPNLEFRNAFSSVWIYGAAPLGALHLLLLAQSGG